MLKHPKPRSISSERENDRRSDSESTQMMTPSLISAFGHKRTLGNLSRPGNVHVREVRQSDWGLARE